MSTFWQALHQLTGVKIKMLSAYHPQLDGASEQTNKTLNQCLRFHVDQNQRGWAQALPRVRFVMMNTINNSTGFSGFQLKMGRAPRIIPPLGRGTQEKNIDIRAIEVIERLQKETEDAKENLLQAKINQSLQANKHRSAEFPYKVGGRAWLSTMNRRREYLKGNEKRVAKFMPRYDGPYKIIRTSPKHSTVTLELPNARLKFPTFHTSQLKEFHENDNVLFPSRRRFLQEPKIMPDGSEEFIIDKIIDEKKVGCEYQYLVRWKDEGPEEDRWLPRRELEKCEALDIWQKRQIA
jgi:hypothetical protein